jgi:uncharacterized protein YndB with AHSA1/START domain
MSSTKNGLLSTGAIIAEVEISIEAPRKVVWDAFVNKTNDWWRKDFYASKGPAEFKVDLKLGGYMYEDAGDGTGLIWFTILGIWPEENLYVSGHSRPPYGGPATGLITFELKSDGESKTIFKISDATHGHVTEEMIPQAQEGWLMIFNELKKYVEAG